MVPKKVILNLIAEWEPLIVFHLNLGHITIKWHVINSKSKYAESEGLLGGGFCVAKTLYATDKSKYYDIVIFYDRQRSPKDAVGSIVHELLHVKMRQWRTLVPRDKRSRADEIEEKLVQSLEGIFLDLLN